jgi:site-specific DNA-cytosine methylase
MKVLSLYSGADNLGDGVIQAGHEVKLAIEMNNDCCRTIKLNHPDTEVINGKVSDQNHLADSIVLLVVHHVQNLAGQKVTELLTYVRLITLFGDYKG